MGGISCAHVCASVQPVKEPGWHRAVALAAAAVLRISTGTLFRLTGHNGHCSWTVQVVLLKLSSCAELAVGKRPTKISARIAECGKICAVMVNLESSDSIRLLTIFDFMVAFSCLLAVRHERKLNGLGGEAR